MYRDKLSICRLIEQLGYIQMPEHAVGVSEYYSNKDIPKAVLVIDGEKRKLKTYAAVRNLRNSCTSRIQFENEKDICVILIGGKDVSKIRGKNIINIASDQAWSKLGNVEKKYEDIAYKISRETSRLQAADNIISCNEQQRYSEWFIYLLAALTIYCYIKTSLFKNTYTISAETVFDGGQSYRLITYMFVHTSFRHLITNIVSLIIIGRCLIKKAGWFNVAIVYLCGGLCAGLCSVLYKAVSGSDIYTAGASGAIFALLGAVVAETIMRHESKQERHRILLYAAMCLILSGGIENDNICHIGGFVFGYVIMIIIGETDQITKNLIQIWSYKKLTKERGI